MVNEAELVGNIIDVSEEPAASIFRAVDEDSSGDTPPITRHHIPDKFNQANVTNLCKVVSTGLMVNDAELVGNIIDVSEEPAVSIFRAVDEDSSGDTPSLTRHHIPDKFNQANVTNLCKEVSTGLMANDAELVGNIIHV